MTTSTDRIIQPLRQWPGLDDDELARRANVIPCRARNCFAGLLTVLLKRWPLSAVPDTPEKAEPTLWIPRGTVGGKLLRRGARSLILGPVLLASVEMVRAQTRRIGHDKSIRQTRDAQRSRDTQDAASHAALTGSGAFG